MGTQPYDPARFIGGNYIDAMALVAKSAWCAVGGYTQMDPAGWEDYDLWCKFAELGLSGIGHGGEPLADYRAHDRSMLAEVTDTAIGKPNVLALMERRHPWLRIVRDEQRTLVIKERAQRQPVH